MVDGLAANGHTEIHLAGKGWGALLSDRVIQVTLQNALTRYQEIAEPKTDAWPLSCCLPGARVHFGLPDCYRALSGKGLRQIEPWDATAGTI